MSLLIPFVDPTFYGYPFSSWSAELSVHRKMLASIDNNTVHNDDILGVRLRVCETITNRVRSKRQ